MAQSALSCANPSQPSISKARVSVNGGYPVVKLTCMANNVHKIQQLAVKRSFGGKWDNLEMAPFIRLVLGTSGVLYSQCEANKESEPFVEEATTLATTVACKFASTPTWNFPWPSNFWHV